MMKRFCCSTTFLKKRRERKDQHHLMKGNSESAAAAKSVPFHLSAAPSLSYFFVSPHPLLTPAAFKSWRHTVRMHHKPYRKFTEKCVKTVCQCIGISQDAFDNGRQRCLEWGGDMLCCFCWSFKNQFVCFSVCVFVCVIADGFGRLPAVSYGI